MFELIGSVVNGIIGLVSNNQETKALKTKGKLDILKAKEEGKLEILKSEIALKVANNNSQISVREATIKRANDGQQNEQDLDLMSMKNMQKSWKDEFIMVIFMTPMVMAFIPFLADHALKGFKVIAEMPEWYRYTIIGMVIVIYGMRGLLTKILDWKKNIFLPKK